MVHDATANPSLRHHASAPRKLRNNVLDLWGDARGKNLALFNEASSFTLATAPGSKQKQQRPTGMIHRAHPKLEADLLRRDTVRPVCVTPCPNKRTTYCTCQHTTVLTWNLSQAPLQGSPPTGLHMATGGHGTPTALHGVATSSHSSPVGQLRRSQLSAQ